MTFIYRVSLLLMYAAAALLAVLCFFVAISAIMRYLVGSPFRFTEELVGLLFVATVFLTLPLCFVLNRNISMSLIVDRLPAGVRRITDVFGFLACLAFVWLFGSASLQFALQSLNLESRSDMAELLLWPWMLVMPISVACVGLILVGQRLPRVFGRLDASQIDLPDQPH